MARIWNICDLDDNCIARVEASTDMEALIAFAEREGFVRYDTMDDDQREEFMYRLPNGRLGAIFTNFEIVAY